MSITLQGQLLLCLLAENLLANVPGLRIIQCNTDGVTVRMPHGSSVALKMVCDHWQKLTHLKLEQATYRKMCIRDVNNYIAQYMNGKVKRKGAYEYDREWHQDHSALVVPKVAEKVLLDGAPIRETLEAWPDKYDFMLRVKVPRSSYLTIVHEGRQVQIQNTTRYLVTKTGGHLFKVMPPLKGKQDWRQIGVESGWCVTPCNDIAQARGAEIDFDFYVREIEKITNCLS
jgi:hypothetical protein